MKHVSESAQAMSAIRAQGRSQISSVSMLIMWGSLSRPATVIQNIETCEECCVALMASGKIIM